MVDFINNMQWWYWIIWLVIYLASQYLISEKGFKWLIFGIPMSASLGLVCYALLYPTLSTFSGFRWFMYVFA